MASFAATKASGYPTKVSQSESVGTADDPVAFEARALIRINDDEISIHGRPIFLPAARKSRVHLDDTILFGEGIQCVLHVALSHHAHMADNLNGRRA